MNTITTTSRALLAGILLFAGISSAHASGTHTGGHGHDEAATGKPGQADKVSRTIKIDMSDDMRFKPATLQVRQGETIRFDILNSGKLKHEFVLGQEAELRQHYALMMKNPEMEHSEANMLTLAAGQSGEVLWQFSKAGQIDFACLQPGHYDAGMKGKVQVSKLRQTSIGGTGSAGAASHPQATR